MRAREYDVLELAVEEGVNYGWNRAHKHVDDPDPESIKRAMESEVLNAITRWFDLKPYPEECRDPVDF